MCRPCVWALRFPPPEFSVSLRFLLTVQLLCGRLLLCLDRRSLLAFEHPNTHSPKSKNPLTPLFATHPKNASVSPLLATHFSNLSHSLHFVTTSTWVLAIPSPLFASAVSVLPISHPPS